MKEYIEREALLKNNMYGNTNSIIHRTYAERLIKALIDENKQLKLQLADYQDKNKLVLKVDITETDKFKTVAEQLAEAMELLKLSANYANNYSGWWSFQGYQDRYEKLKSEVEKNG